MALLKEGWTSLHLDARRAGVVVPASFRGEAHLVLQYGHDLPIAIPDLEVDDQGVRATLSFSRQEHLTVVPWSAVYAVVCMDGRGVLYPEDVPSDVSVIAAPEAAAEVPAAEVAAAEVAAAGGEVGARRLRSIPAHPDAELEEPLATPRRRRPQLRLVK
ncbi:MAG TPA: ClpXP protease specificity-enhancing factor SspB [Polyangia bacterium]|nr:ClpXP protease specificity-enhancing factor SspB [Polyangia bacterium]